MSLVTRAILTVPYMAERALLLEAKSMRTRRKSEWAFSDGAPKGMWGFPKFRGTILGVPILRTIVY